MGIGNIIAVCGEIASLAGVLLSVWLYTSKIIRGQKCLLRSQMLAIYYANRDKREISQYEYENFVLLYEAYKSLKGNSFIDKVFAEIQEWTVTQ